MSRFFLDAVAALGLLWGASHQGPSLRVYRVDHDDAQLYIVTHRAGLLAVLGHDHVIVPTEWRAEFCAFDTLTAGAHGSLIVGVASLVIDADTARAVAGLGGGPSAHDRLEIQRTMLDSTHLAVDQFPEARLDLHVTQAAEGQRVFVVGTLTLRGVTRNVRFPMSVARRADGTLALTGRLRIRQRDFGIKPESRAGVVKVANEVDLHFRFTAQQTEEPCT